MLKVEQEYKTNTTLFKATGVFLNFAREPIHVHIQVYVPKEDSNWHATTSFSPDDIIEVSGTFINLFKNTLSVYPYYFLLTFIKIFFVLAYSAQCLINQTHTTSAVFYFTIDKRIQVSCF